MPNYAQYTITDHAKDRALHRFGVVDSEVGKWSNRLLSQGVYDQTQENHRQKYHWHDIVFIIDPRQKSVITFYSQGENEIQVAKDNTNPEVQTVVKQALDKYISQKKVYLANKIHDDLVKALDANNRMIKPYANYRFTDRSWDEFIKAFHAINLVVDSGNELIKEAEAKAGEK